MICVKVTDVVIVLPEPECAKIQKISAEKLI